MMVKIGRTILRPKLASCCIKNESLNLKEKYHLSFFYLVDNSLCPDDMAAVW